nr:unnamed protein product [Naegleria fowleri]
MDRIRRARFSRTDQQQPSRGENFHYQAIRSVCGPVDLACFTQVVPPMLWSVSYDQRNASSILIPLTRNKDSKQKCLSTSLGAHGEVIHKYNNMDGTEWREIVCNSTSATRTNYQQAQCRGGVKFQYSMKLNECSEKFSSYICDDY